MDTTKKITYEDCKKAIKEVYMPTTEVEWNGMTLVINRILSFKDTLEFVNYVTSLCFTEDTNEYIPEARDLAIRVFLVNNYTNVQMPEDIYECNDIVYGTDIVPTILKNIDAQQFNSIIQSIDNKLEYLSRVNTVEVEKRMNELFSSFEALSKSAESVFGGVTDESLHSLIDAVKNGRLDEEKLVEAYFDKKNGE